MDFYILLIISLQLIFFVTVILFRRCKLIKFLIIFRAGKSNWSSSLVYSTFNVKSRILKNYICILESKFVASKNLL
jgi:hypothetical protein